MVIQHITKKIAAVVLLALATSAATIPAYAKPKQPKQHDKYRGLTKADRKAQKKETKQMAKYVKKQQKAQNKMNKAVNKAGKNKHNAYRPKHS